MLKLSTQVAIIGGGIAGLWLLNRLCQAGYDAVLLEKSALGSGQTLASQGIIHGGLKYALNGVLSPASSAIADMPKRWRACLNGQGDIDLRGTTLLSPDFYMWSGGSLRSRFKTFLGSKALQGRIDVVAPDDYPAFFKFTPNHRLTGTLYQLSDFVIDTPSLISKLARPWQKRILQCPDLQLSSDGIIFTSTEGRTHLHTDRIVLTAGAGNEALNHQWQQVTHSTLPAMQRRSLHMVTVSTDHPLPPYLHCIGDDFGMTPELTLTAHPQQNADQKKWIWYLGGELAESGVGLQPQTQQQRALQVLEQRFPWVDLQQAEVKSFMIDRAEPATADRQRPDSAYVSESGRVIVCWPTKLTLCPDLGDSVMASISESVQASGHVPDASPLHDLLPQAEVGIAPWSTET
ncbi:FAD-binding oxidoreductase [Pseudohongiella spirulinae]|uniref:FAD-binding oxidoreductase n=1 Tax=Pseudohongiella spirulinae TaxID=1249552 RepID=A0A0S2K9Q6_9GAMM|nr:FAD-binding oxidoreductase [Pseudohongiella spirulinae]